MFNQIVHYRFYFLLRLRFSTFLVDKQSFPLLWKSDRMSVELPQHPNHPLFLLMYWFSILHAICLADYPYGVGVWAPPTKRWQPDWQLQVPGSQRLLSPHPQESACKSPISAASYSFTLTAPTDQLGVFFCFVLGFFMRQQKAQGKWILVKEKHTVII